MNLLPLELLPSIIQLQRLLREGLVVGLRWRRWWLLGAVEGVLEGGGLARMVGGLVRRGGLPIAVAPECPRRIYWGRESLRTQKLMQMPFTLQKGPAQTSYLCVCVPCSNPTSNCSSMECCFLTKNITS